MWPLCCLAIMLHFLSFSFTVPLPHFMISLTWWPCFLFHPENTSNQKKSHQLPPLHVSLTCIHVHMLYLPSCFYEPICFYLRPTPPLLHQVPYFFPFSSMCKYSSNNSPISLLVLNFSLSTEPFPSIPSILKQTKFNVYLSSYPHSVLAATVFPCP